jgi:hypothetical protein
MKIIGITSYVEQALLGRVGSACRARPGALCADVREAAPRAVVLPPEEAGGADVVRRLDGLVLAGGATSIRRATASNSTS